MYFHCLYQIYVPSRIKGVFRALPNITMELFSNKVFFKDSWKVFIKSLDPNPPCSYSIKTKIPSLACAWNILNHFMRTLTHFSPSSIFHIETSHLICAANQMTGFYMIQNNRLKWVKVKIKSMTLMVLTNKDIKLQ